MSFWLLRSSTLIKLLLRVSISSFSSVVEVDGSQRQGWRSGLEDLRRWQTSWQRGRRGRRAGECVRWAPQMWSRERSMNFLSGVVPRVMRTDYNWTQRRRASWQRGRTDERACAASASAMRVELQWCSMIFYFYFYFYFLFFFYSGGSIMHGVLYIFISFFLEVVSLSFY